MPLTCRCGCCACVVSGGSPAAQVAGGIKASQVQAKAAGHFVYSSTSDCVRQILGFSGARGFFMGLGATIMRDIPAVCLYFTGYEWARSVMSKSGDGTDIGPAKVRRAARAPAPPAVHDGDAPPRPRRAQTMVAGGIGGLAYWALTYPLDIVKSSMQTDTVDPTRRK